MAKCIIITSYIEGSVRDLAPIESGDFIICADGGYAHAAAAGIFPNLIVGDFDSYLGSLPEDVEIMRVPVEKDDTDTGLCLKRALSLGFLEIAIVGGIGGRFDHSIANLQLLAGALDSHPQTAITIYSSKNMVTMIADREIHIPAKKNWKLSLLSYSECCQNVSVSGVFYPLSNALLHNSFPLGISNAFVCEEACVSVGSGKLLVILSQD